MSDPCSFSSFSTCLTKHLNLQLHVDFDRHVIRGKVQLTVEALEDRFSVLTLDSRDLNVSSVSVNQQLACFVLGPKHSFKGTPLVITLPFDLSRGQQVIVEVTYETSPSASALQWLTPEQTAGKKQPYLFSQCQAHHCRSMIPCQDTPSIKHTYYAQVTHTCTANTHTCTANTHTCTANTHTCPQVSVPKQLVAVMSAVRDGQEVDPQDGGRIVAMPSYLIAIVVGALESREIGPRSRVWSEKEFVDKAASEFSETETMLKTAEDLAGPYVWGQYDVLVLPPSFPYGGMENPCLTFATPTLLAGDKSLSGVIAHEISHSWTGNLVTNRTWEHFWLNEGHTVYLERMIGRRMQGEQFRQFAAMGGWKDLQDSVRTRTHQYVSSEPCRCFLSPLASPVAQVNTFGANNPLTNLVPSLQEVDPDDAFSSVPYEKGFALLYHLEELMGGPGQGEETRVLGWTWFCWLLGSGGSWFSSVQHAVLQVDILNKVDWNGWMFTPGMPPVKPQYDTTLADACITLTQRWIKTRPIEALDRDVCPLSPQAKDQDLNVFSQSDVKTLSSHQLIEFLSLLLQEEPLPLSHVKKMQDVYNLNASTNSEIRFRWLRLCVRSQWEEAVPLALKMATEQGRMKFTRPLFRYRRWFQVSCREVFNFGKYREEAVRVFMAHRAAMHPVTSGLVAKDLKVDASSTGDR
ncbi:hypothetical protein CCH79_00017434 [Gambusia affinis]|uniref:Peptidase M1 leukotriene A4 hydrolase/aminopeptidase C-terminal domain-containing protein n=1 Tax=Gambusia affinis TaxID=33528 RepID=A0A315VS63_GAMAF|nr:hypothetical protein CCH79_00017434 [Gambusia affinis]